MSQNRLRSHYDRKYASGTICPSGTVVRNVKRPSNRFEMTVKLALDNAGGRYLEIGAGSGHTILPILDHYDEVVATEFSRTRAKFLANLLRGAGEKATILCNDIERDGMPFPDSYFDTVVMTAVIEHLIDPVGVLAKLHGALKPQGRLVISTPNIAKWTRRAKLLLGYFPSTASLREGLLCYDRKTPTDLMDEGHLHYFTFRSLASLCMERAGFRQVEKYGYGKSFLCRKWPTLFSDVCIVAYK